jgi:hypothetical protein
MSEHPSSHLSLAGLAGAHNTDGRHSILLSGARAKRTPHTESSQSRCVLVALVVDDGHHSVILASDSRPIHCKAGNFVSVPRKEYNELVLVFSGRFHWPE